MREMVMLNGIANENQQKTKKTKAHRKLQIKSEIYFIFILRAFGCAMDDHITKYLQNMWLIVQWCAVMIKCIK